MEMKHCQEVLKTLTDFYDKPPLKLAQQDLWFEKIKHLDHEVAKEAASEVTSYLRSFPTPNEFLEKADVARSRVASRAMVQDKRQARDFFNPGAHDTAMGKEMVQFVCEIMSRSNSMDTLRWKLKKYEDLSEKYPPKNSWFMHINETMNQIFELDMKQKEKELKRPKLKLVSEAA
jgi:hypothetical protein